MDKVGRFVADAVLGIDTLWGGDVMCPSGTGRFIADSWYSDEPLPARLHRCLGRAGSRDRRRCRQDRRSPRPSTATCPKSIFPAPLTGVREAAEVGGLRGEYLIGLAELSRGDVGSGDGDPRHGPGCSLRALRGGLDRPPPEPSKPEAKRDRVAELLNRAGYPTTQRRSAGRSGRVAARAGHAMGSVKALGAAVIAYFDQLSAANLLPSCRSELAPVPRANIDFLPIKNAWFSGSMNYLGRARNADGTPKYDASYEINASLQISFLNFSNS